MEPGDKLDRVERALATNNYEGLSDRELRAGLYMVKASDLMQTPPVIQSASEFSPPEQTGPYGARDYKVDTVWGVTGKLDLSGRLTFMREESGALRIWESMTGIAVYEGDGRGIGLRMGTDGRGATLFLDEVGLMLEAAYKGVIDRDSVERLYFGKTREQKFADTAAQQCAERDAELVAHGIEPEVDYTARMPRTVYGKPTAPQAYVTWDFGNPKLDPNQQLSGMMRHIHDRMGAVGFDDHAFVLECGQNFRAAIEALPVIDDLFNSWSACTSYRGDVPPHFILADNVRIEAGHHEPNNAMLFPRSRERLEALGRLQECTIKIVGLNVPTETDTLRGKITKLRADVVALRAEVAFLKAASPPKPPSIGEVLGRALGAGR